MDDAHGHHIVTPTTYAKNLVLLMVLMVLTIVAAKWEALNVGIIGNLLIALAIAFSKMTAIMLIFMHVKWSSRLVQVFAVCAFAFFSIFLAFTYSDYMTRWSWHSPMTSPF